jgi:hypothetical protein
MILGGGLGGDDRGEQEGGGKKRCENLFHWGFLVLKTP